MQRTLSLLALTLLTPAAAAAQPAVIASHTEARHDLQRTVETVQAGPDTLDRFELYHVRRASHAPLRRAILLAPPLGTGFQFYENSDSGLYDDSLAATLAQRGFDVWGFSQRVQGIPAGTCEGGAADCSVMSGWGLAQLVGDAEYVRGRITAANGGRRPIVGGMSLGGMIGLAAANASPEDYQGILVLDSALYSTDPEVVGLAGAGCVGLGAALDAGASWSGAQIGFLKALTSFAATDPGGSSPFFPGASNQQAWVTVLSVPNPGPTSPTPSFIFDAGNPINGTLAYADPAFLQRGFLGFVDYITTAEVRDVDCSLAGDRTFTGNLGAFSGPVFAVADGDGFGEAVIDTLSLLEGADITLLTYPDLGHQDLYYAVDHRERLDKPLLRWLETTAFR